MDNSLKPADSEIQPPDSADRFIKQIGPLLILTSIFFLNFVSRIILAPLLPEIEINFNLNHTDSGALFFLISAGYFIAITCSGFISARINHKRTIILANTVIGLALIGTALGQDVWLLRLGLLIMGMASGLYLPSAISTLTDGFSPRHWGKSLAVHDMAPNLSFVAAPLLAEAIMIRFSWKIAFILFGMAALVISPVYARFGRGGEFFGEAPGFRSFRTLFSNPSFWVMTLLLSLGVGCTLGIYTMMPIYLVSEHGIERNLANTLVAFSRISGLVMVFVGGWASDRFGPKRTMKIVLLVGGLLTLFLGVAPSPLIPVIVFLQPLAAACFFPAGFAALAFIVPPKSRNIAVALSIPLAMLIGAGIFPIFIGFVGDIKSFALGIGICGAFIAASSIFAGRLKFYARTD